MMFSIFGDLLMRGWEVRIPSLPGEVCCHFAVAHGAVAGGVIPVIMVAGVPSASGGSWGHITMRLTSQVDGRSQQR